ncbi:acyltransferase family protein [Hansschlegelia quercus]|uniref:Acyltransferase n=1 Tax=Hansschlegelia quercus TaxID=2528245 RepID=A0A4Q9GGQ8_9HYPH|nr:acyltransferase family protein [Hansschlegelia quercus]TBN52541.1 acyltransferase [Hansschlegelia quercus]
MTARSAGMSYRPEIDGLRAVAVLAVVLYHACGLLPGGFAGVDVFFVISGYVITRALAADLANGRFSLAEFYVRRVRRIAPALFVTIAATAAASALILLPSDLGRMGESAIGAALAFSNVVFANRSGYFDVAAQAKPLLHTWSLGVEEQFYLIYPLLLAIVWKKARGATVGLIASLAVASLIASLWMLPKDHASAFFLTPFRFWELALGGLVALRPVPRLQNQAAAWLGLALIAAAFLVLEAGPKFPGMGALLPTLGAALVINGAGGQSAAARLLSARPAVFVGKISYSLYLAHWPLIVLTEYRQGSSLSWVQAALIIAISILIAWISWCTIEQPFRRASWERRRHVLFGAAAAGAVACCAVGAAFVGTNGLPQRLPARVKEVYAAIDDQDKGRADCLIQRGATEDLRVEQVRSGQVCKVGAEAGPPRFIVWGDSHAEAMAPAFDVAGRRAGLAGLSVTGASCAPLLGYDTPSAGDITRALCREVAKATIELIGSKRIELAFLVGRWPRCALGTQFGDEGMFFDPARIAPPIPGEDAKCAAALDATLAELKRLGVKPVIVLGVPEPGYYVPYAAAKALLAGRPLDLSTPRALVDSRHARAKEIVLAAAAKYGAAVIDPKPYFCDADRCRTQDGDRPLFRDEDHITATVARALSPLFEPTLRALGASGTAAAR